MLDSGFMPPFIPGLEMTETTKGEDLLLLLGITRWFSVQLGVILLSTLHTLINAIVCCLPNTILSCVETPLVNCGPRSFSLILLYNLRSVFLFSYCKQFSFH